MEFSAMNLVIFNETERIKRESVSLRQTQSTSPTGRVVAEEQYRACVSQKAYKLYEKRQAVV
jgi:hypothetical protein